MTGFLRLPGSQPVFFDPSRRRWFGFLSVAAVASVLLLGPLGVFVAGVFQDPEVEALLLSRPSVKVAAVPLPEPLRVAGRRPTEIVHRAATIRVVPPVPRARPVFTAALIDSPSFVSLPVVKQGRVGRSIQWLPQVARAKGNSPSIEHLAPMPASRSSWLDMAPATKAPAELTRLRSSEAGWGWLVLSAISGLFISPVQASEYGYEWQPELFALDEGGTTVSTSLRDNLEDIDVFIPAWLTMTENLAIATRRAAPIAATQDLIEAAHDLRLAPMLTCAFRDGCRPGSVPEMLSSPRARKLLVDGLLKARWRGRHGWGDDRPGREHRAAGRAALPGLRERAV